TEAIPFFTNNINNSINNTTISPSSTLTVAIVIPPKNLETLEMDVQNHTILNKTQIENLFIPRHKLKEDLSYLANHGINVTSFLNVIIATGKAKILENVLHGEFYINKIGNTSFYQFFGKPPFSGANIIATNITKAFLEKPDTLINLTQAVAYNVISPHDLAKAYNVTYLYSKGIYGTGTTIGVLDFYGDPYTETQLKQFDSEYNISSPQFLQVQPIGAYNPEEGIVSGWSLEISLDVEYSHAIAPKAGIILYVANPNIPLPADIAFIDQQDSVNVVSQSFGIPELYVNLGIIPLSYIQSLNYEYWLGEVEGITFVAASGDYGGNGYNYFLFPNGNLLFPASDPYVLAVGGSTLYVNQNNTVQTAWSGESTIGASTGGYSSIFPAPWYQNTSGYRIVPDIIADANPYTGVNVLYYHGETVLVGGTSVASPTTVGIIDLITEIKGRLGFINPLIYDLKGTKAIEEVNSGYNTPYTANSSLNPVTGLGYINAGYLANLLHVANNMCVAVNNMSYLDGQVVHVVVKTSGTGPITGFVYNGKTVISKFSLQYNGSYWIGSFTAQGSGEEEVIVTQGSEISGTYIDVGLQASFILPEIAIYPESKSIPILVELLYPNGSAATASNSYRADILSYNVTDNTFSKVTSIPLKVMPIINISSLGILIKFNSSYLLGYYNTSNVVGGIDMVKIPGIFGFTEIVLGAYVVPIVLPGVFTEPTSITSNENFTLEVAVKALNSPNVTVQIIGNSGIVYQTRVNAIEVDNNEYYIKEINIPSVKPGYYKVIAYATYNGSNYEVYGSGFTQIYIAPGSLNVNVTMLPSRVVYENQTIEVKASITYPNGTPVRFGTFSAVIVPDYLKSAFDSLSVSYSTPLNYVNGSWIAYITTPSPNSNPFGYSAEGLSGNWEIYVYGESSTYWPTQFPNVLNYQSLSVLPSSPNLQFELLPYTYIYTFNGTLAYRDYIYNATIINHNATFIDSVINNLKLDNGTITLINSIVYHNETFNGKIIGKKDNNQQKVTESNSKPASINYMEEYGILTLILVVLFSTILWIIRHK
ncbi:peptidase S53, partial [Acidianus sp. DSM 29099]